MSSISILYTTVKSLKHAEILAAKVIEANLAACVNIVPGILSFYKWGGKIGQNAECSVLMKTSNELIQKLQECVISIHSYDTPCILTSEVNASEDFGRYILDSLI